MKAIEFDTKFDNGEDITEFLDLSQASRPGRGQKRVNVDFPTWMVDALDREARKIGVTRQSIIKIWLAELLEQKQARTTVDVTEIEKKMRDLENSYRSFMEKVISRSPETYPIEAPR